MRKLGQYVPETVPIVAPTIEAAPVLEDTPTRGDASYTEAAPTLEAERESIQSTSDAAETPTDEGLHQFKQRIGTGVDVSALERAGKSAQRVRSEKKDKQVELVRPLDRRERVKNWLMKIVFWKH